MSRFSLLIIILSLCVSPLFAQYVVKGTVVNEEKHPIAGAKVELSSAINPVFTKEDGSFYLENNYPIQKIYVSYKGMRTKVQEVKPNMVVRMEKLDAQSLQPAYTKITKDNKEKIYNNGPTWRDAPRKFSWLIAAQGAFPEKGFTSPSFGGMIGFMKTFGGYVKGVYNSSPTTEVNYVGSLESKRTGEDKRHFYAITGGGLYRIKSSPVCFYLGAGYAYRKVAYLLSDGKYAKDTELTFSGATVDYGLMLKLKFLVLNGGVLMSVADGCHFTGNLGVGVCF